MSQLMASVAAAYLTALMIVLAPGPITVMAGRFAITGGPKAAAVFLSAVTCLDVVVFGLVAFGWHAVITGLGGADLLLPVGGAVLVWMGTRTIWNARCRREKRRAGTSSALSTPFACGLLVAAANPMYWLWWGTGGASFVEAVRPWGIQGLTLVLVAFVAGAASWYVPLILLLSRGARRFGEAPQRFAAILLGFFLVVLGLTLIVRYCRTAAVVPVWIERSKVGDDYSRDEPEPSIDAARPAPCRAGGAAGGCEVLGTAVSSRQHPAPVGSPQSSRGGQGRKRFPPAGKPAGDLPRHLSAPKTTFSVVLCLSKSIGACGGKRGVTEPTALGLAAGSHLSCWSASMNRPIVLCASCLSRAGLRNPTSYALGGRFWEKFRALGGTA